MVRFGEHWEPPVTQPLLITVHALADRLDITLEHAYRISYRIGRVYCGQQHGEVRVFAAAADDVAAGLRAGIPLNQAVDAVRARRVDLNG
jgi:Flp pilus assembly protein TadB